MSEETRKSVEVTEATSAEPHADENHGDTIMLFGREYHIPLYTAVFFALAVLTVLEVLIAGAVVTDIKIPFLLAIAVAKALLVILFYMHLSTDSRIFAFALALPLAVALLSMLFLFAVPATGY
jgi:caa(3)-type oxidase subunit IV